MISFEKEISLLIVNGLRELFGVEVAPEKVNIQPTKKEFVGQYTYVTFPLVGVLKKSPEEIGTLLGEYLVAQNSVIQSFNIVKGFLNLSLTHQSLLVCFKDFLQTTTPGFSDPNHQKVMVEYSSPNTNKPLHLGHLRNNFLGYSLSEILKANGYDVVKANLINDRGIHICKSMLAYTKYGNGETPASSGLKGDHLVGKYYVEFDKHYRAEIETLVASGMDKEEAKKEATSIKEAQDMLLKWEQGDVEVVSLWKQMNEWVYQGFEQTYTSIGVNFDKYYYESNTYLLGKDIVEEGLASGVFFLKDNGSAWIDLTDEGQDQKLVLRGDGTSVYITQDMGTADLKYKEYSLDRSIYVVGNEQDYHFDVLFKILKKLGRPYADGLYHMSYGMVDLPSGKMKSREGTVVDADDLISEMIETAKTRTNELGKIDGFTESESLELYRMLALGALKYFILRVDPQKRMMFNPEESIDFQGNTGPFIQYTHARIAALLRKGDELDVQYTSFDNTSYPLNEYEVSILYQLTQFKAEVTKAGINYSPAVIAQYVYDLAKEFNRFYVECPIFKDIDETTKHARLSISFAVGRTIAQGMKLLGIDVPNRM